MREWILANHLAEEEEISQLEVEAKENVRDGKNKAWEKFFAPIKLQVTRTVDLIQSLVGALPAKAEMLQKISKELSVNREPLRRDVMKTLKDAIDIAGDNEAAYWTKDYYNDLLNESRLLYNSNLYNEGERSALNVQAVEATYEEQAPLINGYETLNKYFDQLFANNPKVVSFGEDVGYIGDVNQGFSGLQAKYGVNRIADTGIRELTIMGQGIGLAFRGLRPIAEIQYIDYLLYGLQPLSDDASTIHFRTKGKQSCPLIVRTRGHRLEGIWHSGSPMGTVLNAQRGMLVSVPSNMTQAAGMYTRL